TPTSISNNRPGFNQPHHTHIESQVFSNSNKHHNTIGGDLSGRLPMTHRTNEILPTPPNILAGASRTQPGRFGTGNPVTSTMPLTNGQIPRFGNITNRNSQQYSQTIDSTASNSTWNKEQNNISSFNVTNQQPFARQQSSSSQFGFNQRTDDDKISMANNQNRLSSTNFDNQQVSFEQKRSFASRFSHDDRNEKQMSGNYFQKNDNATNESGLRRGAMTRGSGGFSDRGARDGLHDRHMDRSNDGHNNNYNASSSGGFSQRGGNFTDRGGRSGNFHDRNNFNRNQINDHNENNMQRSQNFNNNTRGGFQNRRGQGDDRNHGGFERRGHRGSQRGSGFSNSRGGRNSFRDDETIGLQLSSDYNNSIKTSNSLSNTRTTNVNFEAGDHFIENEIPKEIFKYVISHIETANDFFIQILSKGDELSKLSEILQNQYEQAPATNLSTLKIGQACLAKSSDDCWYRAIVILTGLNKLKVRFIDFGDTTEVNSKTIRQLEKKHCLAAPYAYECKFANVQTFDNVNNENIIKKCAGKEFEGKINTKTSDNKFILESNDFLQILLETNAIKLKPKITSKRIHCFIAHVEPDQHEFFIQDDKETADKVAELVTNEEPNASTLTIDEVKQLLPNTMVIAMYENEPYRAIIQSNDDKDDDNINVCYVDYGNTNLCSKTSLKNCSEQLSSYPYQSKRCQLYGIKSNEIDNAFQHLADNSDSENIEISIINKKNSLFNVLLYIDDKCVNEKFGYDPDLIEYNDGNVEIDDQPSTPIATTIIKEEEEEEEEEKEQEQPISVDEKQTNDDVLPQNESSSDTPAFTQPENNELMTEETLPKYRSGFLTHIEQNKPYVYIQLIPESESIIEQINQLIEKTIEAKKHNSSYEIGDHVIAQFTQDDTYYRARIESYSSETNSYTVYFLDYGNLDENVQLNHLYSYSEELKNIEPQALGYLLNNVNLELWTNTLHSLMENKFGWNDKVNEDVV
ncbi:unnamed protein product, partial [Rotaria sp. Silwood2]